MSACLIWCLCSDLFVIGSAVDMDSFFLWFCRGLFFGFVLYMFHVFFYDYGADIVTCCVFFCVVYFGLIECYYEEGRFMIVGVYGDLVYGGLFVFISFEVVEQFHVEDSYVENGFVERWRVELWIVVMQQLLCSPTGGIVMKTWLIVGVVAVVLGFGGMSIVSFVVSDDGYGGPKGYGNVLCVQGVGDVGEMYYLGVGNIGYDVVYYDFDLKYDLVKRFFDGEVMIIVVVMECLCCFNFDLCKLDVKSVIVDGYWVDFMCDGCELIVMLRWLLEVGVGFMVVVDYFGEFGPVLVDFDGFIDGWNYMSEGSYMLMLLQGVDMWYLCNNTTFDKVTFTFMVMVLKDFEVMLNGQLVDSWIDKWCGMLMWVWDEIELMVIYLVMVNIGEFMIFKSTMKFGVLVISGIQFDQLNLMLQAQLDGIGDIIDYFGMLFGLYLFLLVGVIVDVIDVGYQMEMQMWFEFISACGLSVFVYEFVHQWFGDDVVVRWMCDVWFSEGFVMFAVWLWIEHIGGVIAQLCFDSSYAWFVMDAFWMNMVFDLGAMNQYQNVMVYTCGAMTLQVLCNKIGDDVFFCTLKVYQVTFGGGMVLIDDFILIVECESVMNFDAFFNVWFYQLGKFMSW